jgi:hypothetical protein
MIKTGPYLGVLVLLSIAPSAFALGEAMPRHEIRSFAALKEEVARYDPGLSQQDVEDLAAWLNRNFYKLEK